MRRCRSTKNLFIYPFRVPNLPFNIPPHVSSHLYPGESVNKITHLRPRQTRKTPQTMSSIQMSSMAFIAPTVSRTTLFRASKTCLIHRRPLNTAPPCLKPRLVQRSTPIAQERSAGQPARSPTQQETPWNKVTVLENSEICEDHRYIVINVGVTFEKGSLTDSYRTPGMYVKMRPSGADDDFKPGFFAISCSPNVQGIFEFLIKETEGVQWLCNLKDGDNVEMSPVQGRGFPMQKLDLLSFPPIPDENKPKDILLFATGSGIAPIRAAIEAVLNGLNTKQRRSVKLFYGARYPKRMAYRDRFKLWEEDGVEIIQVMSRPQESDEPWEGRTGYIQGALKEIGIEHPAQTAALLCGVRGMTEDVTSILKEAGVPEDKILMNF